MRQVLKMRRRHRCIMLPELSVMLLSSYEMCCIHQQVMLTNYHSIFTKLTLSMSGRFLVLLLYDVQKYKSNGRFLSPGNLLKFADILKLQLLPMSLLLSFLHMISGSSVNVLPPLSNTSRFLKIFLEL